MNRKVEHVNFSFFPAICVGPRFFCYHGNMTLRLLLNPLYQSLYMDNSPKKSEPIALWEDWGDIRWHD